MGIAEAKRSAAVAGDALAASAASAPVVDAAPVPNWYCLAPGHAPRLVTLDRLFSYEGEVDENGDLVLVDQGPGREPVPVTSKAPVCPRCSQGAPPDPLTGLPRQVRVSAVPAEYDEDGVAVIPAAILAVATRAGEGF